MVDHHALAEAHAHERRRLLTAFVCGQPPARPTDVRLEPARTGRSLAGGAVLAALLTVAFAIPRLLAPAASPSPTNPGALLVDEHGVAYVVVESTGTGGSAGSTEVSEVANTTSAMLLLGADVEAERTTSDALARQPRGPRIGIVEAPGAPPRSTDLDQDGWTACTRAGAGTTLDLGGRDDLVGGGSGAYAATAGERSFVVAGGRAYEVPAGAGRAPVLAAAAQRSLDDLPEVPREWVRLFPRGATLELAAFGLSERDLGVHPQSRPGVPTEARVGDLLHLPEPAESGPSGPAAYLVRGGDVLDLTDFALAVYRALPRPAGAGPPQEYDVDVPPGGTQRFVRDDPELAWPDRPVRAVATTEVCAVLDTGSGGETRLGVPASGVGVADDAEGEVRVVPGHGALVREAGAAPTKGGEDRTVALVDDRGHLFTVDEEAREQLGYADVEPVAAPAAWLALLTPDVGLSVDAARCPVGSTSTAGSCEETHRDPTPVVG